MSHTFPLRPHRRRIGDHRATTPSPLRHSATIPNTPPEDDWALKQESETPTRASSNLSGITPQQRIRSTSNQSKPERESLRTLPQAPNPTSSLPSVKAETNDPEQFMSAGLSTSETRKAPPIFEHPAYAIDHTNQNYAQQSLLDTTDLEKLGRSATKQLRTLSKLAEQSGVQDFTINSLQRNLSQRPKKTSSAPGYGGRTWMDTERQFRQAYEYLCHVGEAKEWIEHVIGKPIPPIVQLEETMRDGVTLAEVVQALCPEKRLRIFRHSRLQYRHSDNIVLFFNFLAEVELPELFRFELVDLYEKKNIPKVIYCIHALSWLLLGRGLIEFRIGNLVGRLKFEDHELETAQKGLDKAGVSMPNFSGMGEKFGARPEPPSPPPEPEPEPVESEDERSFRELHEHEPLIVDLQAQIRGAVQRLRLGNYLYGLYQEEAAMCDLQARLRGIMARQSFDYSLQRHRFAVGLQSKARGYLVRAKHRHETSYWQGHVRDVVRLQSLVRARTARKQVETQKAAISRFWSEHTPEVIAVQNLVRRRAAKQKVESIRRERRAFFDSHERDITLIQNLVRKRAAIKRVEAIKCERRAYWNSHEKQITTVQSIVRRRAAAFAVQKMRSDRQAYWKKHTPEVVTIQSLVRSRVARKQTQGVRGRLQLHQPEFAELQAAIRGTISRQGLQNQLDRLQDAEPVITKLQSNIRGFLHRKGVESVLDALEACDHPIIDLQSQTRAMLARIRIADQLDRLYECSAATLELQAAARGMIVRARFEAKQLFFKENIQKVIKLQSFARMKQQGEAYKSLTSGKNPPVSTIKNFVHLLNDSDFDFDQELESEKVQQRLVQQIKAIEVNEDFIAEVDAKIGLLAHTKIASDEIAKVKRQLHAGFAGLSRKNTVLKDTGSSASLNRYARAKLERYQELFFILQTQPQYLARLFRKFREHGASEAEYKKLESLTMSTFAFAQKRREEYFLLKVLARSIKEEADGCASLQDFVRGKFFFTKLLSVYIRAPKDRKYIQQLLSPMIKTQIIENEQLSLESDPAEIYRSILNDEELRTGTRSERDPKLTREEAIRETDVRRLFVSHLQDIRDLVDYFLSSLRENTQRMPFGTRYIAKQMFEILRARFPRENARRLLQVVGSWVWKVYIKPALTDPEGFGLVDCSLDDTHRRNLTLFSKVMAQIAIGKFFDEENVYLQPLNRYLEESAFGELDNIWTSMIDVPSAEAKYEIGQLDDFYAKVKPTLYIKLSDVFAMHQILASSLPSICISQEDNVLREVIHDLGSAKSNEVEMGTGPSEVTLALGVKMHAVEDPDAKLKTLMIETKRCALYIIRVQTGSNLLDIMVKPITEEDRQRWETLVSEELAVGDQKRNAYADSSNNLLDIASFTYEELKQIVLENIIILEQQGRLTRQNQYQDLLNEIAVDIRTKHRRRVQRQQELETARTTSAHLDEKNKYLLEKLDAYNRTFEQNVEVLQKKSVETKKFVIPFSKQWTHERELAKVGRAPKFGSWRRSGEHFASKGVLLSWEGRDLRVDDLTISSDKVNEFVIEGSRGSLMIPGGVATFTWDDLLTAEYEGKEILEFFGGEGVGVGRVSRGRGRGGASSAAAGVLRLDRRALMLWLSKKFLASG